MNSAMDKRPRAKNFSEQEKAILIHLVGKYKDIVDNKQTDATSARLKKQAWDSMAAELNAVCETNRTGIQVLSFYKNMKHRVKKILPDDKAEVCKSDVDKFEEKKMDLNEKILNLTKSSITPLQCEYDNHPHYYLEPRVILRQDDTEVLPIPSTSKEMLEEDQLPDKSLERPHNLKKMKRKFMDNLTDIQNKLSKIESKSIELKTAKLQFKNKEHELKMKCLEVDLEIRRKEFELKDLDLQMRRRMFQLDVELKEKETMLKDLDIELKRKECEIKCKELELKRLK